jgi:aryl-alcohol dehydrogenase-like predicted oxidoreductase
VAWHAANLASGLDELREPGESRTAFLLRFTLSHPDVHTIIVGTLYPEHLQENIAAVKQGPLPANVYQEAKRRLERAGVAPVPTG